MSGMSINLAEVLELPVPERVRLVEAIWDSIAAVPEALPLTEVQRKILDERLEEYRRDPNAGSPWSDVKRRILSRK